MDYYLLLVNIFGWLFIYLLWSSGDLIDKGMKLLFFAVFLANLVQFLKIV
jgi:hypothetical protein